MLHTIDSTEIFCVGLNYKKSLIELREKLFLNEIEQEDFLLLLKKKLLVKEALIFSTCNRLEFYLVLQKHSQENLSLKILSILTKYKQIYLEKKTETLFLQEATYSLQADELIKHLCYVRSGLDSQLIGETQITGQVRKSFLLSRKNSCLGPVLEKLNQISNIATKRIRSETAIGKKLVSLAHVACDVFSRIFHTPQEKNLLIIGAGEMAHAAARYALSKKYSSINLINRTLAKSLILKEKLDSKKIFVHSFELLEKSLAEASLVIVATAAKKHLITYPLIKSCLEKNPQKTLSLVDLALPRNIDPLCNTLENIYLFNIDDLKATIEEHFEKRKEAKDQAELIISEQVKQFNFWLKSQKNHQNLINFKKHLKKLCQQEAQKTLKKKLFKDLSLLQEKELNIMLSSIINKLTADVASQLNARSGEEHMEALSQALTQLSSTKQEARKAIPQNYPHPHPKIGLQWKKEAQQI